MEMGRPSEAEKLVGKALGLVKLGSTMAFASRWEETIFQVPHDRFRSCLFSVLHSRCVRPFSVQRFGLAVPRSGRRRFLGYTG